MSKQTDQYLLFNIHNNLIKNCSEALSSTKHTDAEIYDQVTTRYTISNDDLLKKIQLLCFYSNQLVDIKQATVHYITYSLKGHYDIESHTDQCDNTIIIYLDKSDQIKETFYVENNAIQGDELWKNGGLIMKHEAEHRGSFSGSGFRSVLCIFY